MRRNDLSSVVSSLLGHITLLFLFIILPRGVQAFITPAKSSLIGSLEAVRMDGDMNRIFVYGSLLSGLHNHIVLSNLSARFLFKATSKDKFFLTGLKSNEYPYLSMVALHPSQVPSTIQGEVYEVTSTALSAIDDFECHPDEYLRTEIEVLFGPDNNTQPTKAYSYLLRNEERIRLMQLAFDDTLVPVANGDWKTHHTEKLEELGGITDTRVHLK